MSNNSALLELISTSYNQFNSWSDSKKQSALREAIIPASYGAKLQRESSQTLSYSGKNK